MTTLIRNILQIILHSTIAFILTCIDGEIVYRWEFWIILSLIVLIRVVDAEYKDDK
jgi:hypothetical protein